MSAAFIKGVTDNLISTIRLIDGVPATAIDGRR
jgi:hypothetical protein